MSKHIFIKSPSKLSCLAVVYKAGSVYEDHAYDAGVSHLLEHMIYRSAKAMEDELQVRGIDSNAFTGDDGVVFFIRGLEDQIAAVAEKWLDGIINYVPNEKDFKIELPIVTQEAKDYSNDPDGVYFYNFYLKHYGHCTPIGNVKLLHKMDINDIKACHDRLYNSPEGVVYCGKKDLRFRVNYPIAKPIEVNVPVYNKIPLLDVTESDTGIVTISTIKPLVYSERLWSVGKLAMQALGNGLNSPLYQILREKLGLTYHCAAYIPDIHKEANVPMLFAKCSKGNYSKVEKEMLKLLKNPKKWLTDERLEIVRSSELVEREKRLQEPYLVGNLINKTFTSYKEVDISSVTRDECIAWIKETFKDVIVNNSDSK